MQKFTENLNNFAAAVIGIPFVDRGRDRRGLDCWGLVKLLYWECFGLALPDGPYSCQEPEAAAGALRLGAQGWREVPLGRERPGDVLLTRPCHTGVVLMPGKMLHCCEGQHTVLERYLTPLWRQRILGIYRHAELA